MRRGWDEIRRQAKAFAEDWRDAHYEKGETQSFYNDFFEIFGMKRRQVAVYEKRVDALDANRRGFIDLFWPGTLIVEQKSAGKDLYKADSQAFDYFDWLSEPEQPRYILTCDFQRWRLHDLDTREVTTFTLAELPKHVERFAFILGRRRTFATQAAVNIKAAELLGRLHDALEADGYREHDLERLLVRLLFCLFADDTGIFEPKDIFLQLIDNDTHADGGNVGATLIELFDVLDTAETKRQASLSAELRAFPYVNGALFAGAIRTPRFTGAMREMLLDCARFDWGKVSPAIFGSLFQSVMAPAERRAKGAHYTSEANIMKVIGPLFLDELEAEFARLCARRTGQATALAEFQRKLARLNFLDPACGCGNFLVVAYRELRRLELRVIEALYPKTMTSTGEARRQGFTDLSLLSLVDVGQFHGIEYEEFPSEIARVAMWMTDHLQNNEVALTFSQPFARIPLTDSANIRHADALEVDWADVLPAAKCFAVLGNPPFVGAKFQTAAQRAQVRALARLGGSGGTLDYVAAWFIKAGAYVGGGSTLVTPGSTRGPASSVRAEDGEAGPRIKSGATGGSGATEDGGNRRIRIAFVSTNSITQGEQVAQLWPILFDRYGLEISFAHRTFQWNSEARGKAHVHVVIVGLTHRDYEPPEKRLFSYPDLRGEPVETRHASLTAYLFDAGNVTNRHLVVKEEPQPINGAAKLITGSKPIDGGYLILDARERATMLESEPDAGEFIRPFIGAEEYINGGERWILALQAVEPDALKKLPLIMKRIEAVRRFRRGETFAKGKSGEQLPVRGLSSTALAETPRSFHVTVLPKRPFLAIPQVSSERRDYAPIGWLEPPTIPSDKLRLLINASVWEFSVLTSAMHMAWMRAITGRLKSDYMYSVGVVYNTFPWPEATPAQRAKVEALAQGVLDERAKHVTSSLADLYDPNTMPPDLRRAHGALDRAVDRLYRAAPFGSDRDRVEHLFGLYEALVSPVERAAAARPRRRIAKRRGAAS